MSAFAELILVAVILYLWESTLWLPRRSVILRKRLWGNRWQILSPESLFTTREAGVVPMRLLLPDPSLAPCMAPPMWVDQHGNFTVESSSGQLIVFEKLGWDDLKPDQHYLEIGTEKIRISSPRWIAFFRKARARGLSLEAATRQAWRLALSPIRAKREWDRWKLVSRTLTGLGLLLTVGVWIGFPIAYLRGGVMPTLMIVGWLWLCMLGIAIQLEWLARRVYPGAKQSLRMDALLALLVPFHAMRGLEIASVHAMGMSHAVGMILSTRDLQNRYLAKTAREVLYPRPSIPGDAVRSGGLRAGLSPALKHVGIQLEDFDTIPDRSTDPDAETYCPRCHGFYLAQRECCADCDGVTLRKFTEGS